jgi:hypothetical protein
MISQAGRFEAKKEVLVMQPHADRLKTTGATVLSRALEVKGQEVPPEGARFILSLGIRDEDKRRMLDLLARQQQGGLSEEERDELESYIHADNTFSVLKARALLALKKSGQELNPDG